MISTQAHTVYYRAWACAHILYLIYCAPQPLPVGTTSSHFISSFIESCVEKKKIDEGVERQLQTQVILLDPPQRPHKEKSSQLIPPRCRRLNAKQKRQLKLFEIPKEEQKCVAINVF